MDLMNALRDFDLLAELVGEPTAEIIENNYEDLRALRKADISELAALIGKRKAMKIATAFELGRREREQQAQEVSHIGSSKDAYHVLKPCFEALRHEEFWVLLLSQSNKVIGKFKLSSGGLTSTVVDVRLLFSKALAAKAVGVILAHNHPSGNKKASQQDRDITSKVKEGGKLLDIQVLDHLIITDDGYMSFQDEGIF